MAGVKGKSGRKANERVVRHFLKEILDEVDPTTERKRIANICRKLVEDAETGKLDAINTVFDRLEGRPATIGPGDEGEHIARIVFGWDE